MNKTFLLTLIIVITLIFVVLIKKNKTNENSIVLKEDSVILAFGDSLTFGYGAASDFSYPAYMQKKTGLHIINAGVNGEFSSEGLKRLPSFLEQKPDLVILCHGGNDIINRRSAEDLKKNLLAMIDLIQKSGARVLFVGVPSFGLFGFDTHEVYVEVAEQRNVLYADDVIANIQKDDSLKSDYVHPNKNGYEMMADNFISLLDLSKKESF
jgi:acyl-CoA thioesterase I